MSTLNLKDTYPMSPIVYRMNAVLSRVVQRVPVGTNLGLVHCLWMLLSGIGCATAPCNVRVFART